VSVARSSPICLILAPPRSFASCICAALGQHPALHGFPELNLFLAETVRELIGLDVAEARRTGVLLTHLSGLVRAVAHLHATEFSPDQRFSEARAWIEARSHWTTGRMLDHLLERVAPALAVDKSPRTVTAPGALERALSSRPAARVIHLVRDPVASTVSLLSAARSPDLTAIPDAAFGPQAFGLHAWLYAHRGIVAATQSLGADRLLLLRAEEVLLEPRLAFAEIARWLGVSRQPAALDAMLHPEHSPYANTALDPPGGDNDIGFLRSPKLRTMAAMADLAIPPEWRVSANLAADVLGLARDLGYRVVGDPVGDAPTRKS